MHESCCPAAIMNFFTYGSLMFPDVWHRVAGSVFPTCPALLSGFAAWKVRGETYPGLAPAPEETTGGVLHLGVTPEAAARLDAFEGPFYERRSVEVHLPDGTRAPAFAYVVVPTHRHELETVLWDAEDFRRFHLAKFLGPKSAG
jgi:gamma-glutamylcyclotransferase (GGCT)/AIG2-like uncharacterized protein YtfP